MILILQKKPCTINFNDPFDFNTDFIIVDRTQENIKATFDLLRKRFADDENGIVGKEYFDKTYLTNGVPNKGFENYFIDDGNKGIKDYYKDFGVLCFSEINNDILMWSHYSDGHKGFCLKFDTSYAPFRYHDTTLDAISICVDYKKFFPELSLKEINEQNGYVQTLFPFAQRKWENWGYEKEWRILSTRGDLTYAYDQSALCAIYLGCKTSVEDEMTIKEIIGRYPIREDGSKKIIYNMRLSKTEYKVFPEEI